MEDAPLPDFFESQAKPAETAAPVSTPKKRGPKPGTKKKRTTRAQPAEAAAPATPAAPKPERQKRGPNKKPRQARPVTVPIGLLPALSGMKTVEASMLMSFIGNLQDLPNKSRGRVVAALVKLFA